MDTTKSINVIIDSLSKNDHEIIDILSGYLTPVIALLALYIAYQQYRTNKQRFLFETYERRLKIYNAVQEYLNSILAQGKTDLQRIGEFSQKTSQVVFLFDKSVQKKIDEIFKKSIEMNELEEQLYPRGGSDGLPVGEERNKVSHENSILVKWHVTQIKETKKLFAKKMALK